jgi:hypothetical protein
MKSVNSAWMDEGHISYCKGDGKHYVFNSNDGTLSGEDRWTELKLVINDKVNEDIINFINSNSTYIVEGIEDLTHTLAGELPLGRIVYVKKSHSLYYNTYDNTIPAGEHQTSVCLEDSTNWFYPLSVDLSGYVTETELEKRLENLGGGSVDLSEYVTRTELGSALDSVGKDVSSNKNSIVGITTRVDALESSTVSKEELASKEYATIGHVAESCAGVQNNVTTLDGKINSVSNRVSQAENDINGYEDESGEYHSGIKDTIEKHNLDLYGDGKDAKGVIQDLESYKTEVANDKAALIKKIDDVEEKIDVKLTNYHPLIETEGDRDAWVGSDEYGKLSGKTKAEINGTYTYSGVFDEILFNRINPEHSQPSLSVDLDTSYADNHNSWFVRNNISWLDESKRTILVPAYSVTPNSEDFIAKDIKDSYISYPESYIKIYGKEIAQYTDGLRLGSDDYPRTIGNCKIRNNEGEWEDYSDNYGLPTTETLAPGEYHYHIIGYFAGKNPIINNFNEKIREPWDSDGKDNPIESENFITLYVSKPVYYNTVDGMVESPLKLWNDDVMSDEFTLVPSCQLEQSFMVPRKLKALYIWNDLLGGYGQVPMVGGIPAYFKETIEENGYYTYKYDVATNGHRGAVKIKVEF